MGLFLIKVLIIIIIFMYLKKNSYIVCGAMKVTFAEIKLDFYSDCM